MCMTVFFSNYIDARYWKCDIQLTITNSIYIWQIIPYKPHSFFYITKVVHRKRQQYNMTQKLLALFMYTVYSFSQKQKEQSNLKPKD